MPSQLVVVRKTILEGHDSILTARLLTGDDTPVQQSDLESTMSVNVYDVTAGGKGRRPNDAIFTKTDIVTGTVISNTYATTYWGGKDGTGYNAVYFLRHDSAGTTGPDLRGGHKYLVAFEADATTGTDFGVMRWYYILTVDPLPL